MYHCPQLGLLFSRAGVFADTVYCETYNEMGTDSLELVGFMDAADYPEGAVRLGILPSAGGPAQFAQYVLAGIDGYETYEWRKYCAQGGKIRILLAAGHLRCGPRLNLTLATRP